MAKKMARRIWCDVHMGKDEQVEANSFQVELDGASRSSLISARSATRNCSASCAN